MKWQIWFALKDIKRNLISVIFSAISIGIVSTMLVIVFSQFTEMLSAQKYLNSILEKNISYYDVDYTEKESPNGYQLNKDLDALLKENAYSHIVVPHEVNKDVNYVFLFGNYQWLDQTMAEMKEGEIWIGSDVKDKDFPLVADKKHQYLPDNLTMLATKGNIMNLNHSIIVPIAFKDYTKYTTYLSDDIVLTNMLIFNLDEEKKAEITEKINKNAKQEYHLLDLNRTVKKQHEELTKSTIMYSLYFMSTLFLTLTTIVLSIFLIIDKSIKEYLIHLICGAKIFDLLCRISIFSICLILIGDLISFWFYHNFFERTTFYSWQLAVINFACFILMVLCLWIKLNKKMVTEGMRGDFK